MQIPKSILNAHPEHRHKELKRLEQEKLDAAGDEAEVKRLETEMEHKMQEMNKMMEVRNAFRRKWSTRCRR